MSEETKYNSLKNLIEKIEKAMEMSREKKSEIDNLTEDLNNETRFMMIEEKKAKLEEKKESKAEYDEMTTNSLINAQKLILQIRKENEEKYKESIQETLKRREKINELRTRKMQELVDRGASYEEIENENKIFAQRSEKLESTFKEFEGFQFEMRDFLDGQEKLIYEYAVEIGADEKLNNITIDDNETKGIEEEGPRETGAEGTRETGEEGPRETGAEGIRETGEEPKIDDERSNYEKALAEYKEKLFQYEVNLNRLKDLNNKLINSEITYDEYKIFAKEMLENAYPTINDEYKNIMELYKKEYEKYLEDLKKYNEKYPYADLTNEELEKEEKRLEEELEEEIYEATHRGNGMEPTDLSQLQEKIKKIKEEKAYRDSEKEGEIYTDEEYKVAMEKYEKDFKLYKIALEKYKEDKAKYEEYLKQLEEYKKNQEEYKKYLKNLEKYKEDKAKYDKYLEDKAEYDKYLEDKAKYDEEYAKYLEQIKNKETFQIDENRINELIEILNKDRNKKINPKASIKTKSSAIGKEVSELYKLAKSNIKRTSKDYLSNDVKELEGLGICAFAWEKDPEIVDIKNVRDIDGIENIITNNMFPGGTSIKPIELGMFEIIPVSDLKPEQQESFKDKTYILVLNNKERFLERLGISKEIVEPVEPKYQDEPEEIKEPTEPAIVELMDKPEEVEEPVLPIPPEKPIQKKRREKLKEPEKPEEPEIPEIVDQKEPVEIEKTGLQIFREQCNMMPEIKDRHTASERAKIVSPIGVTAGVLAMANPVVGIPVILGSMAASPILRRFTGQKKLEKKIKEQFSKMPDEDFEKMMDFLTEETINELKPNAVILRSLHKESMVRAKRKGKELEERLEKNIEESNELAKAIRTETLSKEEKAIANARLLELGAEYKRIKTVEVPVAEKRLKDIQRGKDTVSASYKGNLKTRFNIFARRNTSSKMYLPVINELADAELERDYATAKGDGQGIVTGNAKMEQIMNDNTHTNMLGIQRSIFNARQGTLKHISDRKDRTVTNVCTGVMVTYGLVRTAMDISNTNEANKAAYEKAEQEIANARNEISNANNAIDAANVNAINVNKGINVANDVLKDIKDGAGITQGEVQSVIDGEITNAAAQAEHAILHEEGSLISDGYRIGDQWAQDEVAKLGQNAKVSGNSPEEWIDSILNTLKGKRGIAQRYGDSASNLSLSPSRPDHSLQTSYSSHAAEQLESEISLLEKIKGIFTKASEVGEIPKVDKINNISANIKDLPKYEEIKIPFLGPIITACASLMSRSKERHENRQAKKDFKELTK